MVMQGMQLNWVLTGFLADAVGDRLALFLMGAIPSVFLVLMLVFLRPLVLLGTSRHPLVTYVPDRAPGPGV
jgi:hypothetical protein